MALFDKAPLADLFTAGLQDNSVVSLALNITFSGDYNAHYVYHWQTHYRDIVDGGPQGLVDTLQENINTRFAHLMLTETDRVVLRLVDGYLDVAPRDNAGLHKYITSPWNTGYVPDYDIVDLLSTSKGYDSFSNIDYPSQNSVEFTIPTNGTYRSPLRFYELVDDPDGHYDIMELGVYVNDDYIVDGLDENFTLTRNEEMSSEGWVYTLTNISDLNKAIIASSEGGDILHQHLDYSRTSAPINESFFTSLGPYTPPILEEEVVEGPTLAFKFANTNKDDRRVKLVPKDITAGINTYDGSELEMAYLDEGAVGFCLAGNPCYGSTPALAVELDTAGLFSISIGGVDYLDVDYNTLKTIFKTNGLELAEFKEKYVCTPGSVVLDTSTFPEIIYNVGDVVHVSVLVEGDSKYGTYVTNEQGVEEYFPGLVSTRVIVDDAMLDAMATEPDVLMHGLISYSGVDLAHQYNLRENFIFNFMGSDGRTYNDEPFGYWGESQISPSRVTIGGNLSTGGESGQYVIDPNETKMTFIPTPAVLMTDEKSRDWVVETLHNRVLAEGEEMEVSVLSCGARRWLVH